MIALPVEIQLMILRKVYRDSLAFYLYNTQTVSADADDDISNTGDDTMANDDQTAFPKFSERCSPLATLFLAAHTTAPTPSPTILSEVDYPDFHFKRPIASIGDRFALRVALAVALPAWRSALQDIPALWTRIAVPVDEETWGPHVLEAVQEAVDCSKHEPLSIVITRMSVEGDEKGGSSSGGESKGDSDGGREGKGEADGNEDVVEGDLDGGEGEHARVLQVMALLVPHIERWRCLCVNTRYSTSLPLPTIDFAGSAPLLVELDLWAGISSPASTKASESAPRETFALDMPHLQALVMDVHAFCAAFLRAPGVLAMVHNLKLCGPGSSTIQCDGPPAVSVRTLLAYLAQMPSLCSLWLDGAHLGVGDDGDEQRKNKGDEEHTASTELKGVKDLHCIVLSAPVLAEVLTLSGYIPEGNPGSFFDVAEDLTARPFKLEVDACGLPCCPPLKNYRHIELVRIAADEDIVSFLVGAERCEEIFAAECEAFPVDDFSQLTTAVLPGPGDDQVTFLNLWLCRCMHALSVKNCVGIKAGKVREVAMARHWARRSGQDIAIMYEVLLDGKELDPEDPYTDTASEEEEEEEEELLEADTQDEEGT